MDSLKVKIEEPVGDPKDHIYKIYTGYINKADFKAMLMECLNEELAKDLNESDNFSLLKTILQALRDGLSVFEISSTLLFAANSLDHERQELIKEIVVVLLDKYGNESKQDIDDMIKIIESKTLK